MHNRLFWHTGDMPHNVIRQVVNFPGVTPHQVYEALMDERRHAEFTGQTAVISRRVSGRFETFDGWASGKNESLVADKKIVQSWRASDWPASAESVCTFAIDKTVNGVRLTFTQTGVPPIFRASIAQGWPEFYWEPLKKYLAPTTKKRRTGQSA